MVVYVLWMCAVLYDEKAILYVTGQFLRVGSPFISVAHVLCVQIVYMQLGVHRDGPLSQQMYSTVISQVFLRYYIIVFLHCWPLFAQMCLHVISSVEVERHYGGIRNAKGTSSIASTSMAMNPSAWRNVT